MKFTGCRANAIVSFIDHSPIMSWLYSIFGQHGTNYVVGVIESLNGTLIFGAFNTLASALGAALSSLTYVITLIFFLSTPSVAEQARGFPDITAPTGQFLLKDLVLPAASQCLLLASVSSDETRPPMRSPRYSGAAMLATG